MVVVPPMEDSNGPISGFDFNLTAEKKQIMREYGYNAARAMFEEYPDLKWPGPDVAPAAATHESA